MSRRRRTVTAACLIAAVVVGVQGSAAAGRGPHPDFDAVALSTPDRPGADDVVQQVRFATAGGSSARISGIATTSVICDQCTGSAETVQVVRASSHTRVVARNVATAWAGNCTGCEGWALSIQVVIAHSHATVEAANRALALNAACAACQSGSAAVQLILVGTSGEHLSARDVDALYGLRDALGLQLRRPSDMTIRRPTGAPPSTVVSSDPANASLTAAVEHVQGVLAADLQAGSATNDIKTSGAWGGS
jgi:hypothetical protein